MNRINSGEIMQAQTVLRNGAEPAKTATAEPAKTTTAESARTIFNRSKPLPSTPARNSSPASSSASAKPLPPTPIKSSDRVLASITVARSISPDGIANPRRDAGPRNTRGAPWHQKLSAYADQVKTDIAASKSKKVSPETKQKIRDFSGNLRQVIALEKTEGEEKAIRKLMAEMKHGSISSKTLAAGLEAVQSVLASKENSRFVNPGS